MDKYVSTFFNTTKSLSRNPLGIISLFIALVYAISGIVISFAKPEFYSNPYHPIIIFMVVFPVIVLVCFAHLVTRHHTKLYAPVDFENQEDFFRGVKIPDKLDFDVAGAVTSDSSGTVQTTDAIRDDLAEAYSNYVDFGFVLLHKAEMLRERTEPKSGRYRVRVWIETLGNRSMAEIEDVTYHLWEDFPESVLSTSDRGSEFDLWLSIYGEFPVLASIRTRDGGHFVLQRYLDLPDRPPD